MRVSTANTAAAFFLASSAVSAWTPSKVSSVQQQQQQQQRISKSSTSSLQQRHYAVAIPSDVEQRRSSTNSKTDATNTVECDDDARQGRRNKKSLLDPQDQWIADLDYAGFGREVTALGKQLQAEAGDGDVEHLNKIVAWRNAAAVVGVATMWMNPNPLTIVALSTWTYASWTMIAHHSTYLLLAYT